MSSDRITTHYMRHAPETAQCNESVERVPFNVSHQYEALNLSPQPFTDKEWPTTPAALPRDMALELVNKWNRNAEQYRYWLED